MSLQSILLICNIKRISPHLQQIACPFGPFLYLTEMDTLLWQKKIKINGIELNKVDDLAQMGEIVYGRH